MRIGVCGTGTIASWISDTICQMNNEDIVLYTCATSPGFDCADFAKKYGYQKISESFDVLMQDPEVDLVYIAMPNNFHYELCRKAIDAGKNVVCEKPFSVHAQSCREVLQAARDKGVFISEALWPAFLPSYQIIRQLIVDGRIGKVKSGTIYMLDNVMFLERVKHIETGGGVLLDEGPYALGCMTAFFGTEITAIESSTRKLDTGVDAEDNITVTYKDGRRVEIHQSMDTEEKEHRQYVEIEGTHGKIWMNAVANPTEILIQDRMGKTIDEIAIPEQIHFRGMPPVSGYEYEWIAFEKALRNGEKECSEIPNKVTQCMADVMTKVLQNAGIIYPFQ